jgi:hypothetical protein
MNGRSLLAFYPHDSFEQPENPFGDSNDPIFVERLWYQTLTQYPELVERLINPSSARDQLLKIRAEPLLDHPRLYRVVRRRANLRRSREVLHDEYREDFQEYLTLLPSIRQMISEDVPAGYVLARFYDAMCLRTDYGKIIVISEVLRYFLYFMTLGTPEFAEFGDVPTDVQGAALVIAVRTMALSEALDFDLDPRGEVPTEIDTKVRELVTWQMRFVIGHEYAHHGLGHVNSELTNVRAMTSPTTGRDWGSYRRSWENEFEADLHAILDVAHELSRMKLVQGAVLFFLHIFFHERIAAAFDPEFAMIDTHPPTQERLERVIERFGKEIGVDSVWMERALEHQSAAADSLVQHFRENPELMSMYGSVYLASWRGKELVDRVDY